MEEIYPDDPSAYYLPGSHQAEVHPLIAWMKLFFRQRRLAYILSTIVLGVLAWLANNWFAPVFFLIVAFSTVGIMRRFQKHGNTVVIECRMQGEVIRHCRYFREPIWVPHSWIRVHVVPNQRLKDVRAYGDSTPPVSTNNVTVVDYYEALPNGDIILVYPEDANFSNFALYARMNPDLASAMQEVGAARMANQDFKEAVLALYHEGRLGASEAEAEQRLRGLLVDVQAVEKKLGASAAANRSLWMYYKTTIPRLHKEVLMLQQELPRIAMAEAAKLVHVLHNHPMSEATHDRIQSLLGQPTVMDYDERVERLLQRDGAQEGENHRDPATQDGQRFP